MAIAFDSSSTVIASGVTTVTIPSFTVSGTNRLLFVTVGSSAPTASLTTSVVRDNGGLDESLTEAWDLTNTTDFHASGHYRVAPATGSYTILVTLTGPDDEIGACATSWTGVDQSTPIGTPVTDEERGEAVFNPTLTVSDAGDDDVVIDGVHVFDNSISVGADQTERANLPILGAVTHGCSTQLGSVSGDVMSWTGSAVAYWAAGAVAIKPFVDAYDGYGTPQPHTGVWPFSSIWRPARV